MKAKEATNGNDSGDLLDVEVREMERLRALNLSYEALLELCAAHSVANSGLMADNNKLMAIFGAQYERLNESISEYKTGLLDIKNDFQEVKEKVPAAIDLAFATGITEGKAIGPRKGAAVTHKEHRAMKADVFAWLDENMSNFRSMEKAAEAIAGKVVPIGFRTARDWVGDWKKERSAGKA